MDSIFLKSSLGGDKLECFVQFFFKGENVVAYP